jgi:mannose-6-phosphate isomerase-like protein (cupin superfamily)
MQLIDGAGRFTKPVGPFDTHWVEQFRVPDLSVGTYSIPAGGTDDQDPHTEDEIYVVTAGRAMFESGGKQVAVAAGSVIFVAAGEVHRFADVTEDLATIVLFAPAEGSRSVPHLLEFVTEHVAVFNAATASGDFSRLLARFTDDAVMRFENVPGAGVLEFEGREAYSAAYDTSPPADQIDVAGDPREEQGAVVIDFLWRHAKTPAVMRLTLNDEDLISHMVVVFGYR